MIDIKTCVKSEVVFRHYFDGSLWYETIHSDLFPVPVSDIGNAVFKDRDKGILFMRYMRKWNEQTTKDS